MGKSTVIPRIADIETLEGDVLRKVLLEQGVQLVLDSHNWAAEYPYRPMVVARMAYSDSAIAVMFDVEEEHTRAVELADNGRVWEDSCVEFFVANPAGEGYFNFEMNVIGTLLAAFRLSRESATHFNSEQLGRVVRFGLFEHHQIDITEGCRWWVAEVIPFSLLGLESTPKALRANLYKCGDKLNRPHFMSWSPITLDKPNFHCPEFFGTLIFEEYE